jgi:hypothetical protein
MFIINYYYLGILMLVAGKVNSNEALIIIRWARRVEDILAGFGDVSKKPADLGSIPSESVLS